MDSIRKVLRGATSCLLFAAFGIGALILSPLMLVLGRTERCQPVVRQVWRPLVWLFVHTGLIRIDPGNLPRCRGTVVVANHPSLIDVVLLTVLVPRLISVSKPSVVRNSFMGVVARSVSIPIGEENFSLAEDYLRKGWNILVFPEGTRSPFLGTGPVEPVLFPFRRGAAQLALRTGSPIVCVGVRVSRRILAKGQPAWDMGTGPVEFSFRADRPTEECRRDGESFHAAARRVTAALEERVRGLLA